MELVYKPVFSMVKPSEIEFGLTTVYLRKNITSKEIENTSGDVIIQWSYQEAQMSKEEFEKYYNLAPQNIDNNQLIIMEAIADLYDAISNMSEGGTV